MDTDLTTEETRVLACLLEKEMTTPEYYPLSMNALVNACNQKSNRNPVVAWDEQTVSQTLEGLKERQLVWQSNLSRVPKYEERFVRDNNLIAQETAILCILMLRGPQTAGEIKARTQRMYSFAALEEVHSTLEHLTSLNYVMRMPRQPGRKEVRYCHQLGNDSESFSDSDSLVPQQPTAEASANPDRVTVLEEKIESLATELEELKQAFAQFKQQFE